AEKLAWTRLGSAEAELPGREVHRLVIDKEEKRLYVCTSGGLLILSLPDHKVLARITKADGLPADEVLDVARIGDRLYFACRTSRLGGTPEVPGLAALDRKTGLIRLFRRSDGLKVPGVAGLAVEKGKLHVYYRGPLLRRYVSPEQQKNAVPVPGSP